MSSHELVFFGIDGNVRGFADWQTGGMREPPEVTAATAEYQRQMDLVTGFLDACCQIGDSALQFEVCFFVENAPGRELGRALDQVNRDILRRFARLRIQLATPLHTVWLRDQRSTQGDASELKRAGEE